MDRLDFTSPSADDRDRAALMIARAIVSRLDDPIKSVDPDQLALPIP